MSAEPISLAARKAGAIRIATVRIEGELRIIRDMAGLAGVEAALKAAHARVVRGATDSGGWIA